MTAHLNKLKTIADKLARQGKDVDDKERVCQLLTSLPGSWAHFKSVYFTQDRPLAWSAMEGNVMAEYSRRSHEQPTPVSERDTAVPAETKDEVYMMAEALVAARRTHPSSRRAHSHRAAPYPQRSNNGSTVARMTTTSKSVGFDFTISKNEGLLMDQVSRLVMLLLLVLQLSLHRMLPNRRRIFLQCSMARYGVSQLQKFRP
ncbi:hypothetical protein PI124_g12280 [Phytophthora idaei]|nr:hypothetical protein PI125_g11732 [Phytophthora idaei]KAG3141315.1 hypothetical protein PI126_g15549 [Phytophthora idaei]KAG3242897.1 hypothetical protein PI124_g12280 [Phytophthora idaei]